MVCILIFINKNILELVLIILKNIFMFFQKLYSLHYYIVKINRIVLKQTPLIKLIDRENVPTSGIRRNIKTSSSMFLLMNIKIQTMRNLF